MTIEFAPGGDAAPYALGPGELVWQLVEDVLGRRKGLKTRTRDIAKASRATEVESERLFEVVIQLPGPGELATGALPSLPLALGEALVEGGRQDVGCSAEEDRGREGGAC